MFHLKLGVRHQAWIKVGLSRVWKQEYKFCRVLSYFASWQHFVLLKSPFLIIIRIVCAH